MLVQNFFNNSPVVENNEGLGPDFQREHAAVLFGHLNKPVKKASVEMGVQGNLEHSS